LPHERRALSSAWSAEAALSYLSDFSNAATWDPGVVRARRLDDGPVRLASGFDLEVRVGPTTRVMRYEVTALSARSVTLRSASGSLRSEDTVTVEPSAAGCTVTYDARLALCGVAAVANPLLGLAFRRVVDRAAASLGALLAGPA
jgi:carbon monoxide dehydrogenase subunit G